MKGREGGITLNEGEEMVLNFRGISAVQRLPRLGRDLENKNVTFL